MKAAQIGLVIGALSLATAKANLFDDMDEDFSMAEDWEDVDDRQLQAMDDEDFLDEDRMLQGLSDDEDFIDGRMLQALPDDDEEFELIEGGEATASEADEDQGTSASEVDEDEGRGKGRRGRGRGRRGRGRGRGRGRKGRKGRGGKKGRWNKNKKGRGGRKNKKGKGKKAAFDYDAFMAKLRTREGKMKARAEKKCEKRGDRLEKGKDFMAAMGDEYAQYLSTGDAWINAQTEKCQDKWECKVLTKMGKAKCGAQFKMMMQSFNKDDVVVKDGITAAMVGQCFTTTLNEAAACKQNVKDNFAENMDGVVDVPKEIMEEVKKAMKAQNKRQRKNKRGGRRQRKQRRNN